MKVNKISQNSWCVILSVGEELVSSLQKFACFYEIPSGHFHGIGALKNLELGYYDVESDGYIKKEFSDDYELISCQGNISTLDKTSFIHLHAAFGDRDFKVIGGHVFKATVSVTAEIFVTTGEQKIHRVRGSKSFNLIDPLILDEEHS